MRISSIVLQERYGDWLTKIPSIPLQFKSIKLDSRTIEPGDVFVALEGTHVDGHDFIESAAKKGAVGAVGEKPINTSIPYWQVTSSMHVFGLLAAAFFDTNFSGCRIAITGSSGKTTVKDMLRAIFGKSERVLANKGNFNNEIGVPKTLLSLKKERYALLEMGARKTGDIEWLTQLFKPEIGILTNIQPVHLGIFGSIENTVRAKSELLQALPRNGCAVIDGDSKWAQYFNKATNAQIKTVSHADHSKPSADVLWNYENGTTMLSNDRESVVFELPINGKHNAFNAALAATAAMHLGISLKESATQLAHLTPPDARLNMLKKGKSLIIDDSYNASPEAFKAAIDVLSENAIKYGLPAVVVMGDMFELGEESVRFHQAIGVYASTKNIVAFYAVGAHATHAVDSFKGEEKKHFCDKETLVTMLKESLNIAPKVILIKGSRGMQMDEVVQALMH